MDTGSVNMHSESNTMLNVVGENVVRILKDFEASFVAHEPYFLPRHFTWRLLCWPLGI